MLGESNVVKHLVSLAVGQSWETCALLLGILFAGGAGRGYVRSGQNSRFYDCLARLSLASEFDLCSDWPSIVTLYSPRS